VKACQEVESHRTCYCCPQHLSDSAWHRRHHHPASSPKKMGEKKTEREAQFVASKTLRKPFQPMILILTIAIK